MVQKLQPCAETDREEVDKLAYPLLPDQFDARSVEIKASVITSPNEYPWIWILFETVIFAGEADQATSKGMYF